MILGIVVRYGTATYPRGTRDGIDAIRSLAGRRSTTIVVVDNALPPEHEQSDGPNVTIRGGDNAVREFTAWDRELARHLDGLDADDVVVLVTDALSQGDAGHLRHLTPDAADLVAEWGVAYGHLDAFAEPVGIAGLAGTAWLRTSCIALSGRVVRRLMPLTTFRPEDLFVSPEDRAGFREVVPPAYGELLTRWLGGSTTGPHRYHAAGTRSIADFQVKCTCIANEHALSARLQLAGVPLVDMAWWDESDESTTRTLASAEDQLAWVRAGGC